LLIFYAVLFIGTHFSLVAGMSPTLIEWFQLKKTLALFGILLLQMVGLAILSLALIHKEELAGSCSKGGELLF